jgi:hypothetical protein
VIRYDYDDFIGRLRAAGCVVERQSVMQRRDGRSIEVWVIAYGDRERAMQIGPGDAPLSYSVVDSIVRGLGLPRGNFDL